MAVEGSEHEALRTLDWYEVNRPCRGERVSGDATVVEFRDRTALLGIVDALGHGPAAHQVALKAESYLRSHWSADPLATLDGLHQTLRGSLGAAAGIAILDLEEGTLRYAGIGNTVIRKFGDQPTTLVSREGIIGGTRRSPLEQRLRVGERDLLLLHTDGVSTRFDVTEYRQMHGHTAQAVALNVMRRFGKQHDDAACICLRYER